MSYIQHKHDDNCKYGSYIHYLVEAAPSILWFDVQDIGGYQGSVYGVGLYKSKILIYEDYYGSCSGCGAWGEGGEPNSESDVLLKSTQFDTVEDTFAYLLNTKFDGGPNTTQMQKAIKEADKFRTKREVTRNEKKKAR